MLAAKASRIQIVVPSALRMGWCQSPTFFCTETEAAREVMEKMRRDGNKGEPNEIETLMMPTEDIVYVSSPSELLRVFVDDFVLACQPGSAKDL